MAPKINLAVPGVINETLRTYLINYKSDNAAAVAVAVAVADVDLKDEEYIDFTHLTSDEVACKIENIMTDALASMMDHKMFSYDVPRHSSKYQIFVPALGRKILKKKTKQVSYRNECHFRLTTGITVILSYIHKLCVENKYCPKHEVFYSNYDVYKDQGFVDSLLDDVSCMLGCYRSDLHVFDASISGAVAGKLRFKDNEIDVDCTVGVVINPNIVEITDVEAPEAFFILLVENDCTFDRLVSARFYDKYPCIIITSRGQVDLGTRQFLRKLKMTLGLPVLGLVDCDPTGLWILSVYRYGSDNSVCNNYNLIIPDIKWLGLLPDDLEKYDIPESCRLPLTCSDVNTAYKLEKEEFMIGNDKWGKQLKKMVSIKDLDEHNWKVDIFSLSVYGFDFLTEVYLPSKLQNPEEWI